MIRTLLAALAFACALACLSACLGWALSWAVGAYGLLPAAIFAGLSFLCGLALRNWRVTGTRATALLIWVVLSSPVHADPACDGQFLGGQRPILTAPASADIGLCSANFATLWSPATRDPIYSAEHLTPENLTKADRTARLDAFHADARLPKSIRAEMSDYAGGEFDRGHLAPAHDMPTPEAMHESFALSNMAPQSPEANRGEWVKVEEFTRRLVVLGKGAFVVTALAFDAHPKLLNDRVAIPHAYLKAVYVEPNPFAPAGQVGAYALANAAGARPEVISLDEMKRRTGLDPFPSLSPADHARADLPPVAAK